MIMMIIAMIMWLMKQKVIMISAKIEGNQQHPQALQQQHQQLLLLPLLLLQEHMMEIMRMWMIIFVGIRKRELTTSMTSAVKHLTAWL